MQFESHDFKTVTVTEKTIASSLYTIDELESLSVDQPYDESLQVDQHDFDTRVSSFDLETCFKNILSESKRVKSLGDKYDLSSLTNEEKNYYLVNSILNYPSKLMRQYREIYGDSERIKNFLAESSNLEELEASGAGDSKWWLFRSDSGTNWIVSCHTETYNNITNPTRIGFEEPERVDFTEITTNRIKEIFDLDPLDKDEDLAPVIKVSSSDIEYLKKMNQVD